MFKKIKNFFSKKKDKTNGRVYRIIFAIRQDGKRTKAFDDAVELRKQVLKKYCHSMGLDNSICNLLPTIDESPSYTISQIAKYFDSSKVNTEGIMAWDSFLKTIQGIIKKDKKKYENVQVYNKILYGFEVEELSDIPELSRSLPIFQNLSEDKIYVGYTFRVMTTNYDEIFEIIETINKKIFKIPEIDYEEAKRSYKEVIRQMIEAVSKDKKYSLKESGRIVGDLINTGLIKTAYDRVFHYKTLKEVLGFGADYFQEISSLCKPGGLVKLAKASDYKRIFRDIRFGIAILTESEPLDLNIYYLVPSDKFEIDPHIMNMEFPGLGKIIEKF